MTVPSSFHDDVWNEVWDSYDSRQAPLARPTLLAPALVAREQDRQRRGRFTLVTATLCSLLLLAATAYAAAPGHAARGVADAFRAMNPAAVAAVVDWTALREGGTGLATPPASRFLAGLAQTVQQRGATPEGLLSLAMARVGPGWPEPVVEQTGLASARLVFTSSGHPGRGLALSLALRETLPPRWLVVGVEPLG